jgi:hypothetical protein
MNRIAARETRGFMMRCQPGRGLNINNPVFDYPNSTPTGLMFSIIPNHRFHPWLFIFNPYRGFKKSRNELIFVSIIYTANG